MIEMFDSIADGLATHGFAVTDQFLSQNEVGNILSLEMFQQATTHFKKAGVGKSGGLQINEFIRGDYIQWLDKSTASPAAQVYVDRIDLLRQHLNQALYLSLKDVEMHMTVYPPGSFYKRHLDQFKQDDHRKISVICYLNPDWMPDHGGQLRIYLNDTTQDIAPTAGRLVCFRSDQLEHEVMPANRERKSITGWMLDQFTDLRHL